MPINNVIIININPTKQKHKVHFKSTNNSLSDMIFQVFSFPREPASFFREYDYRLLSTQIITYVYIYIYIHHISNKLQSESPQKIAELVNIIPIITMIYGTCKELVAVCWVLYTDQRSHHWFSPHCSSVHEAVFSFLASTLKFTATAQRLTMSTVIAQNASYKSVK